MKKQCSRCGTVIHRRTDLRQAKCMPCQNAYNRNYKAMNPWASSLLNAKNRCRGHNKKNYRRYFQRGIKVLISLEDLKFLWQRDNANAMESPTLDRIDSDGNYTLMNCRYIERKENGRLGGIKAREMARISREVSRKI